MQFSLNRSDHPHHHQLTAALMMLQMYFLCRFFNENGVQDLTHCISLNDQRFVIEKVVNYLFVCFTVKYHQFEQTKRRSIKFGNEFWLYHHFQSEFDLFFTSDNEIPNGGNANSVKLIGELKE